MAFLSAPHSQPNLHLAHVVPMAEWSGIKRGIVNRVAVDHSAAGACARGRPTFYRQAKGGLKGGLILTKKANILICNI